MHKHFRRKSVKKVACVCIVAALLFTMLLPVYAMAMEEEDFVDAVQTESLQESDENCGNSLETNGNQDLNSNEDNSKNESAEENITENQSGAVCDENNLDGAGEKDTSNGSDEIVENTISDGENGVYVQSEENLNEEESAVLFDIQKISITDSITTDGRISLKVLDAQGNEITAQQLAENGYTVKWTKNAAELARRQVGAGIYNMDVYGGYVNVSYDDGERSTYNVTVSKDGTDLGSASYFVEYYGALQNNSFESPAFSQDDYYTWAGIKQLDQDDVPGWHTTASDSKIEIGNVTITDSDGNIGTQSWYNCTTAVEGNQIAELNCTSQGALYQDVLTEPGATMYWELSHRGRNGTDKMALVIAHYKYSAKNYTQSELEAFIKSEIGADMNAPNGVTTKDGTYIRTFSDGQSWGTYKGSITVPEGQYVTAFFFVALSTSAGNLSEGNLLDNVYFSTELPPPLPEKGALTITKNIYGLPLETVKNNLSKSFISYTDGENTYDVIYSADDWQVKYDENGKEYVSARYVADELELPQNYTITENTASAQVENYTMTTDEGKLVQNASLSYGEKNNRANIVYTNTYTPSMDDEDQSFILVEKKFVGIAEDEIPEGFKITLSKDDRKWELTKDSDGFLGSQILEDGSVVWHWKVLDADVGVYGVTETGETVESYKTTVMGTGDAVTVGAKNIEVNTVSSQETMTESTQTVKRENGSDTVFVGVMKSGDVAVISKSPLSAGTRGAIEEKLGDIGDDYSGKVRFYSVDEQLADGSFVINGSVITYDDKAGAIQFDNTYAWSANAILSILTENEEIPEIAVTNTYEKSETDLTVKKTVEGKFGDKTKSFEFSYTYTDENNREVTGSFYLKHGESFTLSQIPQNTVITISEISASDYEISAKYGDYILTVENGSVTFETDKENSEIEFLNKKDKTPDTGIYLDNGMYILALAVVAGIVVGTVLYKHKKREE